jgi:hypothetical protein
MDISEHDRQRISATNSRRRNQDVRRDRLRAGETSSDAIGLPILLAALAALALPWLLVALTAPTVHRRWCSSRPARTEPGASSIADQATQGALSGGAPRDETGLRWREGKGPQGCQVAKCD